MNLAGQAQTGSRGYAMAILLISLGVMAILLTAAIPVWRQLSQREKEEELIFRGTQYAHAIGLFQRKYANASPPSIDVLVEQRFLRKKYKDPMVPEGEFQLLYQTPQTPGSSGGQPGGTPPVAPGGQISQSGTLFRSTQFTTPAAPTVAGGQAGGAPLAGIQSFPNQAAGAAGTGGIIGVASKNKGASLKLYNGRNHYNEWQFIYVARMRQPGAAPGPGGAGQPAPGTGQRPGGTGTRPTTEQPSPRRPQPTDQPPGIRPISPGPLGPPTTPVRPPSSPPGR